MLVMVFWEEACTLCATEFVNLRNCQLRYSFDADSSVTLYCIDA